MRPIIAGLVVLLISVISAVTLHFFGGQLGIDSLSAKAVVWTSLTLVLVLIIFLPLIARSLWSGWSIRHSNIQHLNPVDLAGNPSSESLNLVSAAGRWEQLKQIYLLTRQYKNHEKPWILVLGHEDVIQKVLPGIKQNLWVEGHAAFWLDAQALEPVGGWDALRGNGQKPADGVVCISHDAGHSACFAADLKELFKKIGWLLPTTRLYVSDEQSGDAAVVTHILSKQSSGVEAVKADLYTFANQLSALATVAIENDKADVFAGKLSKKLERESEQVATQLASDKRELGKLDTINSIVFAQVNAEAPLSELMTKAFQSSGLLNGGKKLRSNKTEKIYWGLSAAALLVSGLFAYSAYHSYREINDVQASLQKIQTVKTPTESLSALYLLQERIKKLESSKGTTSGLLSKGLGYDHSPALLAAAYHQFGLTAKKIISAPTMEVFSEQLNELKSVSIADFEKYPEKEREFYNVLKAYLMLTTRTDMADSGFLTEKMVSTFAQTGLKSAEIKPVVVFFTSQLTKHKEWAAQGNNDLVAESQQILADWISSNQADERIYKRIINEAKEKYPEITLDKLLDRDLRGIWVVNKKLPSIYTPEGWKDYIKPAFDKVAKEGNNNDWVLADRLSAEPVNEATISRLKERYFSDYAAAWYDMLNSITWTARPQTLDGVNQMHIYADPKRSPLVALFDAIKESSMIENRQVAVNPKVANAAKRAVNSQLSSRERQIANKVLESQSGKVAEAQEQVEAYLQGPLQEKFETLLQLVDANINPKSDLSLQRYLEKVTAVKQRLIQISGSSDAGGSARAAVQNVLGGTNNEFTDALQYSRLLEAGIGDQFLPFARNVFVQPFNITWDSIAGTAQRNINGMWAQSVVMPMESDLGDVIRLPILS